MIETVYEQAAMHYARLRGVRLTKKTLAAFGSVAGIAVLVVVGVVIAYLSDSDRARNQLAIASNSIEIIESFPESPAIITEGEIEKVVQIRNTGTSACFVRVAIAFTNEDAVAFAQLDIDSNAWSELQEDGYYYSIEPLESHTTSLPLLDGVTIGEAPEQGYCDFGLIVHAESVQVTNPIDGTQYLDGPSAFAALEHVEGGSDA